MHEAEEKFIRWIQQNNTGCRFATHLAGRRNEAKWAAKIVEQDEFDSNQVAEINAFLATAITERGFEAVDLIFPSIISASGVSGLILRLCDSEQWGCEEVEVCGNESEALLLGVRWYMPRQPWVTWVLGFADFHPMPLTRRAPVTVLSLRTGPPGEAPSIAHKLGAENKEDPRDVTAPMCPVHLADMPGFQDPKKIAELWRSTKKLTEKKLGCGPASKAALTFCLPASERHALAKILQPEIAARTKAART